MFSLISLVLALIFAIATYYDIRERAVGDWLWFVGAIALGMAYALNPNLLWGVIPHTVVLGAVGVILATIGFMGEADAVAFLVLGFDPNPLSPILPLIIAAIFATLHTAYLATRGLLKPLKIPASQFKKEPHWVAVGQNINKRNEFVKTLKDDDWVEAKFAPPFIMYLAGGYFFSLVINILLDLWVHIMSF